MSRNGMANVRGIRGSEKRFHEQFERRQKEKAAKRGAKRMMENLPSLAGNERARAHQFLCDCSHFSHLIDEVRTHLVDPGKTVFRNERLARVAEIMITDELTNWIPTALH